jgi:hypothetical protein
VDEKRLEEIEAIVAKGNLDMLLYANTTWPSTLISRDIPALIGALRASEARAQAAEARVNVLENAIMYSNLTWCDVCEDWFTGDECGSHDNTEFGVRRSKWLNAP